MRSTSIPKIKWQSIKGKSTPSERACACVTISVLFCSCNAPMSTTQRGYRAIKFESNARSRVWARKLRLFLRKRIFTHCFRFRRIGAVCHWLAGNSDNAEQINFQCTAYDSGGEAYRFATVSISPEVHNEYARTINEQWIWKQCTDSYVHFTPTYGKWCSCVHCAHTMPAWWRRDIETYVFANSIYLKFKAAAMER